MEKGDESKTQAVRVFSICSEYYEGCAVPYYSRRSWISLFCAEFNEPTVMQEDVREPSNILYRQK